MLMVFSRCVTGTVARQSINLQVLISIGAAIGLGAALVQSGATSVIVNGLVLAEDGKKMSKRLKNYPDPTYVMHEYGADALRAYLINSAVVRAEPMRFAEKGVRDTVRMVVLPLWNAYKFLSTYAVADGWSPSAASSASPNRARIPRAC